MSVQRAREEDEEGVAAESATIKCKVLVPAVQLVSTEGACETCKKAGVAAECVYGTSTACTRCKSAKLHCSLAQGWHGQRKPTEAVGSSAAAAVVVEMTKSKSTVLVFPFPTHRFNRREGGSAKAKAGPSKRAASPIKVDKESEDKGQMTLAQSKGKVHAVPRKSGGKSEAWKTQDMLA